MSDNPLETNPAREQRVRERAYELWQADGSPHGGETEYWERARELVGMEDSRQTAQLPLPRADDPHRIAGQLIEEASIQENLGEFPDRSADQGEHAPTPNRNLRTAR